MARDDRTKSKIRDLEGINRSLTKQLRHAHRDNARLQKLLERADNTSGPKKQIRIIEEELEEVLDALEEGEKEPLAKGVDKCEKCGKRASKMEFSDVAGNLKTYMICSDKSCLHRKKI